jgi:hypothetical protein
LSALEGRTSLVSTPRTLSNLPDAPSDDSEHEPERDHDDTPDWPPTEPPPAPVQEPPAPEKDGPYVVRQ